MQFSGPSIYGQLSQVSWFLICDVNKEPGFHNLVIGFEKPAFSRWISPGDHLIICLWCTTISTTSILCSLPYPHRMHIVTSTSTEKKQNLWSYMCIYNTKCRSATYWKSSMPYTQSLYTWKLYIFFRLFLCAYSASDTWAKTWQGFVDSWTDYNRSV